MSDYQYKSLIRHYQSDQKLLYVTLLSLYNRHDSYLAKNIIKDIGDGLWSPQPENVNEFKQFLIQYLRSTTLMDDRNSVNTVLNYPETKKHTQFLSKHINDILPSVGEPEYIALFNEHNIIKTNSKYIDIHFYYLSDENLSKYIDCYDQIIKEVGATRIITENADISNIKTIYLLNKINNTNFFKNLITNDTFKYGDKTQEQITFIYKNIKQKLGLPEKLRLLIFSMANNKKELFNEILKDPIVSANINSDISTIINLPEHHEFIQDLQPILQMKIMTQHIESFNITILSSFLNNQFYFSSLKLKNGEIKDPDSIIQFIIKSKENLSTNLNYYIQSDIIKNNNLFKNENIERVLITIEQQKLEQNILTNDKHPKNKMKI